MLKEAFLTAMLASNTNPNSDDVTLIEVHRPHFDGHTIVTLTTPESFAGRGDVAVTRVQETASDAD